MLYQTDFYLAPFDSSVLHSDIAVKIHGAAMREIPSGLAQQLHAQAYHPFSVFASETPDGYIVRVSALNDAAAAIPEMLGRRAALTVFGCNGNRPVPVLHRSAAPAVGAETLMQRIPPRGCRIDFVTPAVIKTGGRPSAKPELVSYFYSVTQKYNLFEQQEIAFADVQAAFQSVQFGDYQLRSTRHNISGQIFPGMVGFCELLFPADAAVNRLLRLLIAYASYSGIGAKTGQGMGGITVQGLS